MAREIPNKFETIRTIDENIPIITFSDIHADINSLIICLRDCAQVIKVKDGREPQKLLDLLYQMLILDIWHDDYEFDLGYEWIGENTQVVIIGDLIDGYRYSVEYQVDKNSIWYPQIEVKILYFINQINIDAKNKGFTGEIIKLLGNHEVMNFLGVSNENIFPKELINSKYINLDLLYKKPGETFLHSVLTVAPLENTFMSRIEFFKVENFGLELYKFGSGTGIIVSINRNICIHGALYNNWNNIKNLDSYSNLITIFNNINHIINNGKITDYIEVDTETVDVRGNKIKKTTNVLTALFENLNNYEDSPLWNRVWADKHETTNRHNGLKDSLGNDKKTHCKKINEILVKIFPGVKSRVIVGHCTQYYNPNEKFINKNTTLKNKVVSQSNHIIEVFDNTSEYSGEQKLNDAENNLFGISCDCLKHGVVYDPLTKDYITKYDYSLYKVDVGVSRAFDYKEENFREIKNDYFINELKLFIMSRTPQVLKIMKNSNIQIIRSTYENTNIHLQRPYYSTNGFIFDTEEFKSIYS